MKVFIFFLFFIFSSCDAFSPRAGYTLTKDGIQKMNPKEVHLTAKTYYGCVSVPAKDRLKKYWVGFDLIGETCSVIVNKDKTVSVSFAPKKNISLVGKKQMDTYFGDLRENQVLVVQHDGRGSVVSVTWTGYTSKGVLNYGVHGDGDYIKECAFISLSSKICKKSN